MHKSQEKSGEPQTVHGDPIDEYCFNLCDELRSEYQAKVWEKGVTFSEVDFPAFQALCQDLIQENAAKSDVTQGMYDLIINCRQ